jgi:hypothetical protein
MDAKVTLSFDQDVINKAKVFAEANHISLSRLIEYLLRKATGDTIRELEDLPVADWVHEVAEGRAEYKTRSKSRKSIKKEFFESRK